MEYMEKHGEVRSAMQYEHLVKKIDITRPEGLELTLKDSVPREISGSSGTASSHSKGARNKTKKPKDEKSAKVSAAGKNKDKSIPASSEGSSRKEQSTFQRLEENTSRLQLEVGKLSFL